MLSTITMLWADIDCKETTKALEAKSHIIYVKKPPLLEITLLLNIVMNSASIT